MTLVLFLTVYGYESGNRHRITHPGGLIDRDAQCQRPD